MNILSIILSFFGFGKKNPVDSINDLLGRSPDAIAQKIELEKVEQEPALRQIELNKIEARTPNFQKGWRSFFGYVCVSAIAWTYIVQPIVVMMGSFFDKTINIPPTNMYDLLAMLAGILGVIPLRKDQ